MPEPEWKQEITVLQYTFYTLLDNPCCTTGKLGQQLMINDSWFHYSLIFQLFPQVTEKNNMCVVRKISLCFEKCPSQCPWLRFVQKSKTQKIIGLLSLRSMNTRIYAQGKAGTGEYLEWFFLFFCRNSLMIIQWLKSLPADFLSIN